jgi:methionyl-tRNA synthetase
VAHQFLTTPIYYVNAIPHVGHAYTTVNVDAMARWQRLLGDDVFMLTGTDHHGLKIQRAAEAEGTTPQEWGDRNSAAFRESFDLLNIAYDDFIRTSEQRHYDSVQWLLQKVRDNGFITEGQYEGWYCVGCEAYYDDADLLVVNGAENCCPIHKRPVERFSEKNYFFQLSAFEDRLFQWLDDNPDAVTPVTKRNEVLGFIKGGLRDFSISRTSISWGIPIPWDPAHVTYVWFDALTNYATAAGLGSDDEKFATWWPTVRHTVGKDILRFHCVYWPAMLMAAGLTPPKQIHVHGFLLIGGEKLSKTGLVQIFPKDLVAEFGVDAVRYHLLREIGLGADGEFSHEGLVSRYNTDLANNYGNLCARTATVVEKKCGGIGPAPRADSPLAAVAAEVVADVIAAWAEPSPSKALEATWRLVRETNSLLENAQPWKSEPGPEVDGVMGDALEALRLVTILAQPAMPTITQNVWERLGLSGLVADQRVPADVVWGQYPGGLPVTKGDPLFPRKTA